MVGDRFAVNAVDDDPLPTFDLLFKLDVLVTEDGIDDDDDDEADTIPLVVPILDNAEDVCRVATLFVVAFRK